tara:strand:- start:3963 stop:4313 length:351 start_codon:yes stop_codon:yes gene_type:complete
MQNLKVKTNINNVNKTFMFNTNTSFKSKLNYLIKTNNNKKVLIQLYLIKDIGINKQFSSYEFNFIQLKYFKKVSINFTSSISFIQNENNIYNRLNIELLKSNFDSKGYRLYKLVKV